MLFKDFLKKASYLVCLTILLSGCKYNSNKEEKLAQIQTLINRVDVMDSLLQETLPDSLTMYHKDAMLKGPVIDRSQDLTEEENSAFIDYMTSMRFLPRLKGVHSIIQQAADECRKQLTHFSTDVEKGLISQKQFEKYMKAETFAVEKLEGMEKKSFRGGVEATQSYKKNRAIIDDVYEKIISGTYKTSQNQN